LKAWNTEKADIAEKIRSLKEGSKEKSEKTRNRKKRKTKKRG